MKVIIGGGKVLAMSKSISRQEAKGTYIGITTFSRRICRPLFAAIADLVAQDGVNEFFNVAVERLIASGTRVHCTTTRGLPWAEVDDPNDLRYARTRVYPRLVAELRGWKGLALSEDALIPAVHS